MDLLTGQTLFETMTDVTFTSGSRGSSSSIVQPADEFTWGDTAASLSATNTNTNITMTTSNDYNHYNNGQQQQQEGQGHSLVSDEVFTIVVILNNVILSGVISAMGCVFNVINIVIFYRLGFKDTVNISLMSLALADLGALVPVIWKAICLNPYFYTWDKLPFNHLEIQYITAGNPHFLFARVSSLITAFVTFERCLCIAMPLKVRRIITPKRTAIIMAAIFLLIIGSIVPFYCFIRLGPKFYANRNKTLVGLIYSEHGALAENIGVTFNVFVQIFSVVAVIICTIILVVELKEKSSWRSKATNSKDSNATSNVRDVKVVKMILFISIIFIICFLPSAVNMILMVSEPEYSARGRYSNLFVLTWAVFNMLESTNSTVNIFVYFKMSSKYAVVFKEMFGSKLRKCGCWKGEDDGT